MIKYKTTIVIAHRLSTIHSSDKIIVFKTSKGDFEVELFGKDNPVTVSNFLENIKNNISQISSKSVKEIILTGVNIGDYGKGEFGNKKHETTFLELIKELDLTGKIDRFRISSIEPNLLKNDIYYYHQLQYI